MRSSEGAGERQAPAVVACAAAEVREAVSSGGAAVLACAPTIDDVLVAVGVGYLARVGAEAAGVRLARADRCQPALGETVVSAPACDDGDVAAFAARVWAGFSRAVSRGCGRAGRRGGCSSCGGGCLRHVAYACASDADEMPEVVHRYLRLGFAEGPRVRDLVADPRVAGFLGLVRQVSNECERTRQFARFSGNPDGTFVVRVSPAADTVPLVAAHFAARMRTERFALVDPSHGVAALHERDEPRCRVVRLDRGLAEALAASGGASCEERYVRAMWRRFYDAMELEGRRAPQRGYDLRAHWMPKRLWEGLPELDATLDDGAGPAPARYAGDARTLPHA